MDEPLLGDPLELAEKVEFGLFSGVTPLGVDQTFREVKQQGGTPHVLQVLQGEVDTFTDDALAPGD